MRAKQLTAEVQQLRVEATTKAREAIDASLELDAVTQLKV